jgi:hypothetical protein
MLAKLDEIGAVAWLAVAAAVSLIAWPLGLATFAYLAGSGRLYAWRDGRGSVPGKWFNLGGLADGKPGGIGRAFRAPSSGNQAFDAYRADAISRLEEEQREFQTFLERLRRARDKAEFDTFMADRRQRPANTDNADPSGTPD